jgi:hypothetical protein
MAISVATASYGTLIKRGNGATPEVFTAVAEVTKISGPKIKVGTKPVTHMESPGGWAEIIPTIIEGGEVTLGCNLLPANATQSGTAGILLDLKNKTKRNFQLLLTDAAITTYSFAAYVTGFDVDSGDVEGAMAVSITLSITGQPTLP